ncbi:MAG: OmpH family outer membrane protein [Reyranellales bacterium]
MTRKTAILAAALLLLGTLATASTASAQKRFPTPVIAVVDVQAVLQTAEAPKGIRAQIQKAQASFQQGLQSKNDDLKKADQDLQAQRSVLAADAYQQRQREFEQKVADAQREVQDRRGKLETAFNNAMQQVETVIVQIVDQIAKESSATLVINKGAAIYSTADLDITQEVVRRLNARLPSVAVALPK